MGILLALILGGRYAERIAFLLLPVGLLIAVMIFADLWQSGRPLVYIVGGWMPPLGLALRADGLSAAMMVTTAIIICATAIFAHGEFSQPRGSPETRAPLVFWILLLGIWGALNAVVLGADLFNLYVALELLTFAAVPLVCIKGSAETIQAALRYMLFALIGSVLYLLGTVLLYGAYGTLDIIMLSSRVQPEPVAWIAAALMTMGLLAKTALFPFHLWLPSAHAGAPAAGSAVLSALVVKGSFFLIVRLWFDAMPSLLTLPTAQVLATLGAAAIVFGSVLALRQQRLKLLVAYSTVAQIGYLFFIFPLAAGLVESGPSNSIAWTGGWLQVFSHAFAKAAMFMAAGLIAETLGHDRIAELHGVGRALPITMFTFGIAGLSLMGVPPSGGFVAKWLLLLAAIVEGQWWWAIVMIAGGLLAGAYVLIVLGRALSRMSEPLKRYTPVSRRREVVALALALCAVLLGLVPLQPAEFLQIGRPETLKAAVR
ncbi:complex I subunit 5 family protein [Nordella sp. HKS 07]|uniref:complex I subunit 5 family protein n=1 Tax=Nordella sp. HKS 07 TaxID=2712222 RepID=UPI001FED9288|nr:proton-conducting transporter membrane subunit [Nordella sp. HKS 07]